MKQLFFHFPGRCLSEQFFVSSCNEEALHYIENSHDWSFLLIYGPPACGKTHLGMMWVARNEASVLPVQYLSEYVLSDFLHASVFIDDIHLLPEAGRQLLHLYNLISEHKPSGKLLMTSALPLDSLNFLPDLSSRLKTVPCVQVCLPEDEILLQVMRKMAQERYFLIDDHILNYLIQRMERSFQCAEKIIDALDRLSLARQKPVSKALASEVLEWVIQGQGDVLFSD